MVHIMVTRAEDYYFKEADIQVMATDNEMSIEECKEALMFGEFDQNEIEKYCCNFDNEVVHYAAEEEEEENEVKENEQN